MGNSKSNMIIQEFDEKKIKCKCYKLKDNYLKVIIYYKYIGQRIVTQKVGNTIHFNIIYPPKSITKDKNFKTNIENCILKIKSDFNEVRINECYRDMSDWVNRI